MNAMSSWHVLNVYAHVVYQKQRIIQANDPLKTEITSHLLATMTH